MHANARLSANSRERKLYFINPLPNTCAKPSTLVYIRALYLQNKQIILILKASMVLTAVFRNETTMFKSAMCRASVRVEISYTE